MTPVETSTVILIAAGAFMALVAILLFSLMADVED